jgi:AcrR family transcriptional regulator
MAIIRRKIRAPERHEDILRHAAALFKEKGYHGVTMDDIARSLQMSKLSIYYYFESKEDLLYQINDKAHKKLLRTLKRIETTEDPPETKLRRAIISNIEILLSEMSPATVAIRQQHSLSSKNRKSLIKTRDKIDQMFRGLISQGVEEGVFIDCDPKLTQFLIAGAIAHIVHWYSPNGPLTKKQIGNFFADLLIRGLLRNSSDKKPLFLEGNKGKSPLRSMKE